MDELRSIVFAMKQVGSLLFSLALGLSVASCAGPVETRIVSTGPGVAAGSLMWEPLAEDAQLSPLQVAARATAEQHLRAKGYSFAADAPLILSLGLSERTADIALKDGAGRALSSAKGERLLQDCGDRMLRVAVGVVDRTDGAIRYSGSAQEAHCHATMDQALARLIAGALGDIGRPRGSYVQNVSARD
jgi:hypothetical protein